MVGVSQCRVKRAPRGRADLLVLLALVLVQSASHTFQREGVDADDLGRVRVRVRVRVRARVRARVGR